MQGLVEMHAGITASNIRSRVAVWVLSSLEDFHRESKITSQKLRYRQLRELVRDASGYVIYLDALGAFEREGRIGEEGVEFFDELGRQEKLYGPYGRPMPGLLELLSEAFRDHPTRIGILRVISCFSTREPGPAVPVHLLDPGLYDDPMFREAAIIVRLSQGHWSQNTAHSLAEHVIELVDARPGICDRVLRVISRHKAADPFVDEFLLELHERLPATEWEAIGSVIQALNNSLRYRTSRLGDPHIWSDLGLPESLGVLIQG